MKPSTTQYQQDAARIAALSTPEKRVLLAVVDALLAFNTVKNRLHRTPRRAKLVTSSQPPSF